LNEKKIQVNLRRSVPLKERKLYYAFVDDEKPFDRVPGEITRWAMRKAEVEEWLVNTVMAKYEGAQTVRMGMGGDSRAYDVKIGLHQGSVLTP